MGTRDLFELRAAWAADDPPPDLAAYLTADVCASGSRLAEILVLDARERLTRGLAADLDHYVALLPRLTEDHDLVLQLLMVHAGCRPAGSGALVAARFKEHVPALADEIDLAVEFFGEMEAGTRAEAAAPMLHPGRRISHYELEQELGRGSFGVVWMAWDARLRRHVALKLLRPRGADERSAAQVVLAEAQSAAAIDHPNVVKVHASGLLTEPDLCFIDSQLVADWQRTDDDVGAVRVGVSLAHEIAGERPLDPRRAAAIVRDVAGGVAAAHARGIVHRDLKPANVILTPSQRPMVADFGLSSGAGLWRPEAPSAPDDTQTSRSLGDRVVGSPAFMSPEQARGEPGTPLSDIYGLGAILFALLTGTPPRRPGGCFHPDAVRDVIEQLRVAAPLDRERLDARAPRVLADITAKALATDAERRYGSAELLARDLEDWLASRPTSVEPASASYAARAFLRRHRIAAAAMALLLVVGVAATAHSVSQIRRARDEATDAVARYDQLADVFLVGGLLERSAGLWPRRTHVVPALRAWLDEAERPLRRRSAHAAALTELRRLARPHSAEDTAADVAARRRRFPELFRELVAAEARREELELLLDDDALSRTRREAWENEHDDLVDRHDELMADPRLGIRFTWSFDDPDLAWRHGVLVELVAGLDALAALVVDVQARLDFASSVKRRTVEDERAAWEACIADVPSLAIYGGLRVAPQEGLVPLGRDHHSGLWELWHPGSGDRPEWVGPILGGRVEPDAASGLVFILVPGGRFRMGAQSDDPEAPGYDEWAQDWDAPVHEVALDPYLLSKYEMTQAQWLRVAGANPSHFPAGSRFGLEEIGGLHPVESINKSECEEMLRRLDLILPTEARWERAARAGTETRFWPGADVASLQGAENICDEAHKRAGGPFVASREIDDGWVLTSPVGSFRANRFGFHDVAGNVAEWCRDSHVRYDNPPAPGDGFREAAWTGPGRDTFTVVRGGCAFEEARSARLTRRNAKTPDHRSDTCGVRPAAHLRGAGE